MTAIVGPSIPLELIERRQWINWALEFREGKPTKVPYVPGGKAHAKTDSPASWRDFQDAAKDRHGRGVGFVFTADDSFTGVDLDHSRDPETDYVADWAQEIVDALDSYAEYSPSGTGIHVIVKAVLPEGRRRRGPIEMYDRGRYFTMTGQHVPGTPLLVNERQEAIEAMHARLSQEAERPSRASLSVVLSDSDLIERARNAKNGGRFWALWSGDTSAHSGDESRADLALCCNLAFWVGPDAGRIDRLFRDSGLYRSKWEERRGPETYGSVTIAKALSFTHEYYRSSVGAATPPTVTLNGHAPAIVKAPFPLTDLGNAERLVDRCGARLRYCGPWKSWLDWRVSHWDKDETNQVERYAKATVRAIYAEAADSDDVAERKAISRHALKSESDARIKAMISLASSEASIPVEPADLDSDPWLFNVANGTLDLRTGELREHRPSDLMTKISPIIYDPDARLALWERFLVEATGESAELMAFLQRAVGYSLTGSTQEEKLFFVHGPTRAGKSTFLDAIKMLLGTYGMTADFDSFLTRRDSGGPRQDIAILAGARFVMSIEVDEGKRLAEGLVKMLTGGDTITARYLFGREFEFRPAFKLWLAANSAPRARTDDDAIWNRIVRIPFNHVVPEEKRDAQVKLALQDHKTAGPALLAWAVKGCLAWQRDGLKIPEEVKASSAGYRLEVDQLAGFIDDRCTLAPDGWAWTSALTEQYEIWAKANNERKLLVGKAFGARLRARGCVPELRQKGELGQARGWSGITLQAIDDV